MYFHPSLPLPFQFDLPVAHSLDIKAASTLERSLASLFCVLVYSVSILCLSHV